MQLSSDHVNELITAASTVIVPAVAAVAMHLRKNRDRSRQRTIRFAHQREHIPVMTVHNTMGPRIFWRAFRMNLESFWRLYSILLPHIQTVINRKRDYLRKGE